MKMSKEAYDEMNKEGDRTLSKDLDKELRERNGKLFWYHYDKMKEAFERGANLHVDWPPEMVRWYTSWGCDKYENIDWEDFFKFVDEERELSERWQKK